MKKLYYIANIRMPTEKAHGIQIMEMCKAFAALGHEVELVVPDRATPIGDDPFGYYDVEPTFKIRRLWCLDLVRFGKAGFWIESLTFANQAAWYTLFKDGIFYTRDELVAVLLRSIGKRAVWEAHMGHTNVFARLLIRLRLPLVVISRGLKELYQTLGMPDSSILVAPDGVEIGAFDIRETRSEARTVLGFAQEERIVLYTGHLFSWKGADTLAEAAKLLSPDTDVVFVGGTESDLASFRSRFGEVKNIRILGKKPHQDMPLYLRAADLLVIPNSGKEDISRLYTSPMKLFEYMASGTPIVASDLPSIREVLDESIGYFAEPDDDASLAAAIDRTFAEYPAARAKAVKALEEVRKYSWKARAEHIVNFIAHD